MSTRAKLAALLSVLGLVACGGSEERRPAPPPPPPPPRETLHHLPKLPEGWHRELNRRGGFGFGLPRGWKAEERGRGSLIRSFDRLVAVSIVPDRSRGALDVPIVDYATRAAVALPGYKDRLRLRGQERFRHRYEGTEARALGTARGGVEQRVSVIVLRRDEVVTFTIVLAKNAERSAAPSRRLAERVIETLRSRPPQKPGKPRGERRKRERPSDGEH